MVISSIQTLKIRFIPYCCHLISTHPLLPVYRFACSREGKTMFESIPLVHIYLNPKRNCSLVSGRWLLVKGESRYRLDLNS